MYARLANGEGRAGGDAVVQTPECKKRAQQRHFSFFLLPFFFGGGDFRTILPRLVCIATKADLLSFVFIHVCEFTCVVLVGAFIGPRLTQSRGVSRVARGHARIHDHGVWRLTSA